MLQLTTMTEQEITDQLLAIIKAQPDGDKWLDYYSGGTGTTLLRMLTAAVAFLNYQVVATRREASPLYNQLRSSIMAAAYTFGYPVNRRVAARVKLTMRNTGEPTFWPKDVPLGYWGGIPVSLVEDASIPAGTFEVEAVLGDWVRQTTTVETDADWYEHVLPIDVDIDRVCNENVHVLKDGEKLSLSRYVEDVTDAKVIQRQTISSISFLFGSAALGIPVTKGSVIDVQYLQLSPIKTYEGFVFETTSFSPSGSLALEGFSLVKRETPEDSNDKVVKLLPGYFAAKRRMVNPADHVALVKSYPGIISAAFAQGVCTKDPLNNYSNAVCTANGGNWVASSTGCCTHIMSYLRYDGSELTPLEEDALLDYLQDHQISGEYLIFRKGKAVKVNSKFIILVTPGFSDETELRRRIMEIQKEQMYQLGGAFQPGEVLKRIGQLGGVIRPYISRPYKDKRLSWQGYFSPGTLEIEITSDPDKLLGFGTEDGGYEEVV